ncbi:TetR/AcrR family transcriptional regulator [Paenibacillus montanisoli]|uniref:TetR/AcrR family transcriptional regulator n=1 Tax=Paenibacillus montanisoli TaxID=2081970 RepID=A0A328UA39_9BACL|nr:TetR/AcrR family transcriptional regulator [Paenibacillus montanisoli]RAP77785.1 TetR/AcrR family transcriptional regulator [Paenibacillus montanisoli]
MKQEERREQTTRLLLQTTKKLILEKGCASLTLKDIMERSELSKGAIFHYVKSKDELFAWVLQERLEETNKRFMNEVGQEKRAFDGPMDSIAANFHTLEDPEDVTNKVFVYLLGKEEEPAVRQALNQFYERSVLLARGWIAAGQEHGVIPETVNADSTAEMFVLISFGLRIRSTFSILSASFTAKQFTSFITGSLHSTP